MINVNLKDAEKRLGLCVINRKEVAFNHTLRAGKLYFRRVAICVACKKFWTFKKLEKIINGKD